MTTDRVRCSARVGRGVERAQLNGLGAPILGPNWKKAIVMPR